MRVLKWTVIVLLALVGLPLAAILAINAFDESLTPEAARYGEPRAPSVPDMENGYYALLALAAGDGEDGMAYAKAWVAEARAAAKENRPEKPLGAKRAQRPDLCDAAQTSCLAAISRKEAEVASQLAVYREDLERYEKLIAFRRYEEVLDYPLRVDTRLPPFADVVKAQRAYVARAALASASGAFEDAVAAIERDIAFHRVMLGGARTILGKMVACSGYWRDLAFIADLLERRGGDVAPLHARLQDMLKPLDPAALRISSAIETEFSFSKQFLKEPLASQHDGRSHTPFERFVLTFLYKPNATINGEAGRFLALTAADRLPVNQGSAELDRVMQEGLKMRFWDYIDNPAGNLLVRWSIPEDGADAYNRLRLHDLDAYNRLIGLRVAMLEAGVTADLVAEFVAKADARFHDLYTGKPMAWDPGARQLSFTAKSRNTATRKLFNVDKRRVFLQL